jgi:hypothetical protein
LTDLLLTQPEVADVPKVELDAFDALVKQAEDLCTLSLERTMFTPTEVMDLMLDVRQLLLNAKLVLADPVPA